jgi:hypothetical protein
MWNLSFWNKQTGKLWSVWKDVSLLETVSEFIDSFIHSFIAIMLFPFAAELKMHVYGRYALPTCIIQVISCNAWNKQADSSVSITIRLRAKRPGSRFSFSSRRRRVFSFQSRPDRPWGPPILLSSGYGGCFPDGKAARAWIWPLTPT